ncbi:PRC-barrel domain-containing protein [Leisingera aquaemixtae]|uniref:PRC-barrel domain-containing protein n=1 Tax=Leisingera aquaemixtae TaxID=1396826 RepID=A0ABY5WMJ9_9RHOB|nr:PRC-barrel domain-containing protein [Leisingera aquaemixtae]UWQ42688.1 PRC-barrel domain-containing protein [Leisingera aquaemixtae]
MQQAQHGPGGNLVSTNDVTGTAVYDKTGEKAGTIDHLMIDKSSGKAVYAIMTFGGFLGLGEREFVIPWGALSYDSGLDGFRTSITPDQLKSAPAQYEGWHRDRKHEESIYDHYHVPYYWF